jgi:flavin-dependent dehydrogenase
MAATGCPPVDRYRFDFGFFTIEGSPRLNGEVVDGYGPRRYVIDALLVDAADRAGAEVRTGFAVEEILRDDAGSVVGIRGRDRTGAIATERARVVIGADGRRSLVAKAVKPAQYNDRPTYAIANYAYFSNLPVTGFNVWARDRRGWGTLPTNDGLTVLVVGWPEEEYKANRSDIEGNVLKSLEQAPEFAEQVGRRSARRVFVGRVCGHRCRRAPHGRAARVCARRGRPPATTPPALGRADRRAASRRSTALRTADPQSA